MHISQTGKSFRFILAILFLTGVTGCGVTGVIVGALVDTTIEVAKVPFKVGGAVIDVATDDDDEDENENNEDDE